MTNKSSKTDVLASAASAAAKATPKAVKSTEQKQQATADFGDQLPVIPGTEQSRSLGEIIREAEQASKSDPSFIESADKTSQAGGSNDYGQQSSEQFSGRTRRSKKPPRSRARRHARERALQALYQWDVSDDQSTVVREQFLDAQDMSRVDLDYFLLLYNGVTTNPQKVDESLLTGLDRPISDLDPIERAVLRVAAYELSEQADIPARVIINEGIEITKRFGADKGHRYVNGVLDKLAMHLRPQEMKPR